MKMKMKWREIEAYIAAPEEILRKYDAKELFSAEELEVLAKYNKKVDEYKPPRVNGHQHVKTFIQVGDRHFMIKWYHGSVEHQDDVFPFQPQEVEKYDKVVETTVQDWREI